MKVNKRDFVNPNFSNLLSLKSTQNTSKFDDKKTKYHNQKVHIEVYHYKERLLNVFKMMSFVHCVCLKKRMSFINWVLLIHFSR